MIILRALRVDVQIHSYPHPIVMKKMYHAAQHTNQSTHFMIMIGHVKGYWMAHVLSCVALFLLALQFYKQYIIDNENCLKMQ